MDAKERGRRWVLGFDGGCGTCNHLAQQLVELSEGKLTAQNLRSPKVQPWREQALGSDAPWAPTLFAVDGVTGRAWTGTGLITRLGRLVGPQKLWKIATIVGGLMDPQAGPASPARRTVVRQGLVGMAAAFALLNGTGTSNLTALAQSDGQDDWRADRLGNADFNALERRAEGDREFQIIRDYFAQEHGRDWRGQGRAGYRILKNGKRVRDAFWVTYMSPGEDEWAHVMLTKEAGGKESINGWLWRGKPTKFTDRFYVQNGNLRRENSGRVEGAGDVGAADTQGAICLAGSFGPCILGTGAVAAACAIPLIGWGTCGIGASVAAGCFVTGTYANDSCNEL